MNRHLSSDELTAWMAGGRAPEIEQHLRECPHCAARFDQLSNALSLFRESGRLWSAHHDPGRSLQLRPASARRSIGLVAALAASFCIGLLLLQQPAPRPKARPVEEPFIEIPYVAPLAPYERSTVMRTTLPVSALIAAGFEVRVPDASIAVPADVLVGQDGRVHAIRLVSNSSFDSDRRLNP